MSRCQPRIACALLSLLALPVCKPALESSIPSSYLAPTQAMPAGSLEARGNAAEWLVMLARLEPEVAALCRTLACRETALRQAIRAAASRGVEAAIVADREGALWRRESVATAAQEAGLLLIGASLLAPKEGPELTLAWRLGVYAAPEIDEALLAQSAPKLSALGAAARDGGGVLILRHPCAQPDAAQQRFASATSADELAAVEIDGPLQADPTCARRLWHSWLREGVRVTGLSASGSGWTGRYPHKFVNLVRTSDRTAAGVVAAIDAGHVQMVRALQVRPRLHLGVDLDGDGRLVEARQGDQVALTERSAVVQVRVIGGQGREALLYSERSDRPVRSFRISANDQVHAFLYTVPAQGNGFVRVELYRGGELEVISNPIYFAHAPGAEVEESPAPSGAQ